MRDRFAGFAGFARRRLPHLQLAAFTGGLACSPGPLGFRIGWILAAAGAGRLARIRAAALLWPALALAGLLAGGIRVTAIDRPASHALPGAALTARATLLERPRAGLFGSRALLRVDDGPARGLKAVASLERGRSWPPRAGPGLQVRIHGIVRRARPPGPDGFDYPAFLRSRGIGRELGVTSIEAAGRRGGVAGVVDRIRERAESGMSAGLPPPRAALARGMVLGEDGDVALPVREDFQASGLAHLLAASGQNVMLLCALALPLLIAARAGHGTRIAVLAALVVLYVPLAGGGASVQRAGVMAAAGLIALAAGRPSSAAYALLFAAAATLGLNPRATGDPGWQLSFAAVAGMLALTPPIQARLRFLPAAVAVAIAVTVAASLATAPLMAHQFGAVSIAALPANLAAIPVVAPVMWIGMAQAAVAQLGAPGVAMDALAAPFSGHAIGWIEGVAGFFAAREWAQAEVRLSWPLVAVAYAMIAAVAARLRARRKPGDALPDPRPLRLRPAPALAALAAAIIVLAVSELSAARVPHHQAVVDFLDVGQGDAVLIRDDTGAAVLFDGGPPEARVDRLIRRLGVRRLSIVVATHMSRDHHGGLLEVVRRLPPGAFVDGGDGTTDPSFRRLEAEVRRRGVRSIPSRAGTELAAGAIRIRILSPPPRPPGPAPADPNPRATVAVVSVRSFSLLLSADAESPYLVPLALPRVDAIKVPHHGSADPALPQLLRALRPAVAGIEVGRQNRYGHPTRSTLAALRARVPFVFRTDRDGTVELTVDGDSMRARTHR